jgi:E3 ubiquitin-protein ligase UBR7
MLRISHETGRKGAMSEEAAKDNHYNHNFQNKFCACGEEYDPDQEKGTMFQCVGLGTVESGGCGEDWYHPECLMGLPKDWNTTNAPGANDSKLEADAEEEEHPTPPGFPNEDDFDAFVCYKCVNAYPWIKRYASTPGFLAPVYRKSSTAPEAAKDTPSVPTQADVRPSLKRKASDDDPGPDVRPPSPTKRLRDDADATVEASASDAVPSSSPKHKHSTLPPAPSGTFSLFLKEDFRDHFCHCPACYPNLLPHPQLVEEEDAYEPSVSNDSGVSDHRSNPLLQSQHGSDNRSHRSGSLLDRGEAALNNVDRVRAIEGVMVYNHLKDKVKEFLKPYAESGKAVSADDIKSYFEKLRGDEQGIKEAGQRAEAEGDGGEGGGSDNRREQSGY